jgi:PIN domain nuclease of toxin-antitoxin system
MKLLLDTHVWLWSLLEPERLSPRVRRALEDDANELWLSPISTWEVGMLARKRRLRVDEDLSSWLTRAHLAAPCQEAPLTHDIAIAALAVELPHRDPADRFLVATARVLALTLVTADRRLLEARPVPTLAAARQP